MRKVLDSAGRWRPIGSILPDPPAPSDLRGVTTRFHGRYRGPHNTGVPDKSALKTPRFGGVFSTPNQTFNDEHFIGYVEVRATGIVFNRCYFEGRGDLFVFYASEETTLNDCDLNGGPHNFTADVIAGSVHAVRCHIWGGGQDSVGFEDEGSYEDCYIHGVVPHYGTHSDAAQTLGGTNLAMRRNKFLNFDPVTNSVTGYNAALQLGFIEPGSLNGLAVIDNYIDGGGFTVNGFLDRPGVSGVDFRGNRWGRHNLFGPVVDAVKTGPPFGTYDTATNVFDDNGVSV